MPRLIHTIALAATAVVLSVGLWRGWSFWAVGKRVALAYLGFFFLGAVLALAVRLVPVLERPEPEADEPAPGRRRRRRRPDEPAASGS